MQKWEYGIIERSTVITKTKWSSVEGYYEVKFNGESVMTCDIDNDTSEDQEERCLLLAFNKLGSMGWELCSDTLVYYLNNGYDQTEASKVERIVFRRSIE